MKKILLFIGMFMFMANVNALTFNVDLTNIEDKGNNGTIGSITNIDIPNKTVDAYFQDIGDEVNFELTITNSGNRAGTLRNITVTSTNDKIEYSNNLPDGGLAINGNDTNSVTITAKVKEGATNGKTSSEVKITYNYDEGSCPDGEILSDDESMCLCPEGLERNEQGVCVKPEKKIECADDEIYNETKKICEKKVVPTPKNPSNPKTLDNIVLITLLFMISGLGIYAVLFRKLQTKKQKVTAGVITGVVTLSLSFTVLAGVYGLDNLLGAIVNPITKSKEIIVTVNEEIDLIETWDGNCDLDAANLTPDNIFQGGSGTESDPYQIKTAEQLSCFAKSVNNGTTYEGQYIKQIKNIKLNDKLNDNIASGTTTGLNVWLSAGHEYYDSDTAQTIKRTFSGTYDGDNYIISGIYLTQNSTPGGFKGLFGNTTNATFKNMELSDVYMTTTGNTAALIGFANENLVVDNISTYGTGVIDGWDGAGVVADYDANRVGSLIIENTTNNINLTLNGSGSGIIHRIEYLPDSNEPNLVFRNVTNNGNISFTSPSGAAGIAGYVNSSNANALYDNCANNGEFSFAGSNTGPSQVGGIGGGTTVKTLRVTNCYNTGDWIDATVSQSAGLFGTTYTTDPVVADNCYNSGNLTFLHSYPEGLSSSEASTFDRPNQYRQYISGLFGYLNQPITLTDSYNTGNIEGLINYGSGLVASDTSGGTINNCYNTGNITGAMGSGGLVGAFGSAYNSNISATINNSYNTGDVTTFANSRGGGLVGWGGASIYNSYNTGDIYATGETTNQIGGLCSIECPEIKNSYNTGNITAKYFGIYIAGIAGGGGSGGQIVNTYNSGNITYLNVEPSTPDTYKTSIAGISGANYSITNSYNLGNITINQNGGTTGKGAVAAGIAVYGNATSCVNTGNVKVIITAPYTQDYTDLYLDGISYSGIVSNSFNAGSIEYDDSALSTPIINDGFTRLIQIGEIVDYYNDSSTGNKFTNQNGFAVAQYTTGWQTLAQSEAVGLPTNDPAPSILSIINGDDAFEILEGNELPTLKVFNE